MPYPVAACRPHSLPPTAPDIIRTGLVAYWDFAQGADAQVLYDKGGNDYHGQLGSTAGVDTNDPAWNGGGLQFNSDDTVVLPSLSLTADSWTIMCAYTIGAATKYLFDCYLVGETRLVIFADGEYYTIPDGQQGSAAAAGNAVLTLILEAGADKARAYRNQTALYSGKPFTARSIQGAVRLGTTYGGSSGLIGTIWEFALWRGAMADAVALSQSAAMQQRVRARGVTI